MIFVAEEHIIVPVAALGDVVRNAREYGSCKPGHGRNLTRANNYTFPHIPGGLSAVLGALRIDEATSLGFWYWITKFPSRIKPKLNSLFRVG